MKRSHGSGHLYLKWGSYYGRWRGVDGRLISKEIRRVRRRGAEDGITQADDERGLRRLVEAETRRPASAAEERSRHECPRAGFGAMTSDVVVSGTGSWPPMSSRKGGYWSVIRAA
jgi:hypothetical protein